MKDRALWLWVIALAAGAALWAVSLSGPGDGAAWRALLVSFTYFTPLAAGLATWPAIVNASRGTWSEALDGPALAATTFALPSLALLVLLWIGAPEWAPWARRGGGWLDRNFLFLRDLAALAVFWILAVRYARRRRAGAPGARPGWVVLAYGLAFSLLGFDLVMALDYPWTSALFGAYVAMSGLYAAICAWAVVSVARARADEARRMDLGRLILAFAIMTAYFAYSQLLTVWYENLPEETSFLVARLNPGPWRRVSLALAGVVYLGPVGLLLTRASKRRRGPLLAISLLLAAGLWVERWWLVDALFQPPTLGLPELSATLLALGALGVGMSVAGRRPVRPAPGLAEGEEEEEP